MDADTNVGTSSTALLIWIMRVTMPVILFVIWYCTQGQSKKNQYSRDDLLTVRAALASRRAEAPEFLQTLRLEKAPSSGGAARRDGGPSSKRGSGERTPKGDDHPAGGTRGLPRGSAEVAQAQGGDGVPGCGAAEKPQSKRSILSEEEWMHLESLVNFVAFSARDQPQRIFLPGAGCPPPPPPPPALPSAKALEVNTTEAAKANQEAQMVLRGILNPTLEIQCPDIAHDLHKQLARSHIHVLEKTYCLMVETCIASGDLRGASDFLMKMEAAGHCADSSLLDKVMDLYTESRSDSTGACNGAGGPGRQAGPGPGAGRRGNMWSEHDADDYGD